VRNRSLVLGALRELIPGLVVVLLLGALAVLAPTETQAQNVTATKPSTNEAPIRFWNRVIAVQRGILAGTSPETRAEHASRRLAELPLDAPPAEILTRSFRLDDQEGVGFLFRGRLLFFLGTNDLDAESGEKLDEAAVSTLQNLREALQARAAARSWPVIRAGFLFASVGLVLLFVLCMAIWKGKTSLVNFLRKREGSVSLRLFRTDLLPNIAAVVYAILHAVAWLLTFSLIYLWITLSLRQFPYTEPWGKQAGGYVLNALRELGGTLLRGLPGLMVVMLIMVFTRWLVRMANVFFNQVATGRTRVSWMDAHVARATQRIFSATLWIFAIIIAYPYIPGSRTEAFKGLSIFFGLLISLGSTGIINQIMSGLFVVYSKALKTGEWVKINETEGEVLEVGLLAAKIRTIEGQEVTIPNSVLVATSTKNFTRLGHPDGLTLSSTVTIGYDAPWRQVHALLELAAERTPNIRRSPSPYVIQKQLSDFYVEYTLIARLENEPRRIETVSNLNSAIQDAFNEFGVQIMSPHFMVQPNNTVIVPRDKWDALPSKPILLQSSDRRD
jgi:small-conductance mechanosensitive channel